MKTAKQFLETFNSFTPIDSHDSNVVKFTNGIVVEKSVQENTHFAPYLTYVIRVKVDGKVVSFYGTDSDQCNLDVIVWFSNKTAESFMKEKQEVADAKAKYQKMIG
jgi:hypothetical protein